MNQMKCQEVSSWTFKGLVTAFLDLSITFLLLCASSLVYISSKFLSLFGLNLPCPCNGLFSNSHKCFQETLANIPVKKIHNVQRSVRIKTPFGLCVVGKKRKGERRHVSSCVEEVESVSGFDLLASQSLKKGSSKIKSKRLSLNGLKNHKIFPHSPTSVNDVEENENSRGGKILEDIDSVSLSAFGCEEGTEEQIGSMEHVVKEERAARVKLAVELEKERNAAASAADEAMAMILRLQEEKSSIEMEARQYQRMVEEKTAFDAEEMSILKEILLRREKEKHFLEKEVDTYREMFLEIEQPLANTPDLKQSLMTEPLDDMETVDDDSYEFESFTNQMDSRLLALGNKSVLPGDYGTANSPMPWEVNNDKEIKVTRVASHEVDTPLVDAELKQPVSRFSNISESKKFDEDSLDTDCSVHDIHEVTAENKKLKLNVPSEHAFGDLKLDRSQSVSDTSYALSPALPPRQRNVSLNMRRNSMSAVDYERLKIESEVGLLRGRLRAVQKGREKLSFSSKEQSKSQGHHRLGDKTSRFWEARSSAPLYSSSPSSTMVKAMSMPLDLHSA